MKPYVLKCPGGIVTVTLDGEDMRKIHDYYEEQLIADELKNAYTHYSDTYREALAKKILSLVYNENLSESEAIEYAFEEFPSKDVEQFAIDIQIAVEELLNNDVPEHLSDMEDVTEILSGISWDAKNYLELPLKDTVKASLEQIVQIAMSWMPVTITGPQDVTRLQKNLREIKVLAEGVRHR